MADIIEGRNPVLEALKSGRAINKVLLASSIERHAAIAEILHLAREHGIPIERVPRQILDKHAITSAHQGVIAYAALKDYCDLDDLLAISRERDEAPFYVILDGIEDPQNLGSIIRTAEAASVHGIIIRERRAAGLTTAVGKASAGASEYIPVARVINISQAIETLKKYGVWVIVIDQKGEKEYNRIDYRPPTAIIIGSEGKGVSELVKKRADMIASIPMRGKITSLNASVATALVVYEVFQQRRASRSS